jgi:hypothetical protein
MKATMGEQVWKRVCLDETDDDGAPMGSVTDHAFAMFTLTNNYFVWLAEAKIKLKDDLLCDYDSEKEKDKYRPIQQAVFGKRILNPDAEDKTSRVVTRKVKLWEGEDLSEDEEEDDEVAGESLFDKLKEEMDEKVRQAGKACKTNDPRYKELKKQLREVVRVEHGNSVTDEKKLEEDRLRKQRARALRPYTGRGSSGGVVVDGDESSGRKVLEEFIKEIRAQEPTEKLFRKAYRMLYRNKYSGQRRRGSNAVPLDLNYHKTVWDIGDVERVDI